MTINPKYLHVRGQNPASKVFSILKTNSPIKEDTYFVVVVSQKFVSANGQMLKLHCDDISAQLFKRMYGVDVAEAQAIANKFKIGCWAMYRLESGNNEYFIQSTDRPLLSRYVASLGLDGVEIIEKKKHESLQDRRGHGKVQRDKTTRAMERINKGKQWNE